MKYQCHAFLLSVVTLLCLSSPLAAQAVTDYYSAEQNLQSAQTAFSQGKYTEAVFALERILALQPQHVKASKLLAKTYAKLGEYGAAKAQYTKIKPLLNDQQRRQLAREEEDVLQGHRFSHYALVGFDIGYDNNLTSLADVESVYLPARDQYFNFTDTGVKEDMFLRLFAGGSLRYQQSQDQWWRFDSVVSQRQDDYYNAQQFYAAIAYNHQVASATYKVQFAGRYADADGLDSRTDYQLILERQQRIFKGNWRSELQLQQRRFSQQGIRDDQRAQLKLSIEQSLAGHWQGEVAVNASADLQTQSQRKDLDYTNQGIAFTLSKPLSEKLKLTVGGDYQGFQYHGEDPSFLRERRDEQLRFKTALRYQYTKASSIGARFTWLRNDSNIALNSYSKNTLTFSYIYRFK